VRPASQAPASPSQVEGKHAAGYVLPETTALAVIGGVDLLSTVYLLATGQAVEANALMRWVLHVAGPTGLVVCKATLLAGPLAVAEISRQKHPEFVRAALRVGIAAYALIYLAAFARYNLPALLSGMGPLD
jgi:hypothetical protein